MTDLEVTASEEVADWIETSVLISSSGHLSRDRIDEIAMTEIGAPPAKISLGLNVMARRAAILGAAYPFTVNEFAVLRRAGDLGAAYAELLCLTPRSAARQTVRAADTAEMGSLLEDIAETALANYWGPGGDAVNFGYPSKHGRPEAFDQAVQWLADRMGLQPGRGYRPPRRKDGGVDVVLWRRFADHRSGFPIGLAQCTIQSEMFTKTSDVDLRLWASWLAMDVDPVSILVLPGTVRWAGPDWGQLSTVVMVIERLRLMELLARGRDAVAVTPWLNDTVEGLRGFMRASDL